MKLRIFVALLCFSAKCALAQTTATISGQVFEEQSTEAMPFTTVVLKTERDSSLVTGTLTDERGMFSMGNVAKGNYLVVCTFVGYESVTLSVVVNGNNPYFDLGRIMMKAASASLEAVTVTGERATVSGNLEKKVFNVSDNVTQVGGSVLDAMKNLPGVSVDQDGKVILRGSDKVAVLIDGRQSGLTGFGNQKGLATIPMANIERIEIINNPSSKYDASGMAGIISIIYKEETTKGWNGDVGLALGLGTLSRRKADLPTDWPSFNTNPKITPSINLNRRTDRSNFFFQSELLFQDNLPNNEFTTRFYDDGRIIASQVPENREQVRYIGKTGIDLFLGDKNTLSLSSVFDYEVHTDTAQVPFIDQTLERRNRFWAWREEEVTGFFSLSADFKHKFSQPGRELKANIQYIRGWEDEEYFLNDSSAIRISNDRTHLIAKEFTLPITVDYTKPLKNGRFETGGKAQFRSIPITYEVGRGNQSVIYPELGDNSDWTENIYAGYFNYVYEQKKFDIEAGLRAEQVAVTYDLDPANIYYNENDAYDYFEFYPNVRLSLRFDDANRLSVFYNRRVDRPGEPELRAFPKYDDPELLKVGNPYLRLQFTQTFEMAYSRDWAGGSAFLSVYHRIIDDPFLRVFTIDDSNADYDIVNRIYQNVGGGTNTGLELLLSQTIQSWWKASASFNWYENSVDAVTNGVILFPVERTYNIAATQDNTWDTKINNQLTLSEKTELQLNFIYFAPKNIPQGRQSERSSFDIGFGHFIMKKKAELTFSFSDIFNRFGLQQELREAGFTALYQNFYETQVMRLGIKYKF